MMKRGQELSITTIIIAIIAIVVLVVLIAVFTGRIAIFQKLLGEPGKCTGNPISCESHNTNEVNCKAVGCAYKDGVCSGTPNLCGGYTAESGCTTAGCSWQK